MPCVSRLPAARDEAGRSRPLSAGSSTPPPWPPNDLDISDKTLNSSNCAAGGCGKREQQARLTSEDNGGGAALKGRHSKEGRPGRDRQREALDTSEAAR